MPVARGSQIETKKHRVLQVAQSDPFLTVAEIASAVSTTPKYVRTILSEAGISLANLRKAYAQHVRSPRREGNQVAWGGFDPAASLRLRGEHVVHGKLILSKHPNRRVAYELEAEPDTALLQLDRWAHVGEEPVFLNRLITGHHVTFDPNEVASGQPLRLALGFGDGTMQCGAPVLEHWAAEPEWAAKFGIGSDRPWIQWSHTLFVDGSALAWEAFIFDSERIRLELPPQAANEVRLTLRDEEELTAATS